MLVGKVQVLFPIEVGDVVFAGAHVVADSSVNGFVNGRLLACPELVTEQLVNRLRSKGG